MILGPAPEPTMRGDALRALLRAVPMPPPPEPPDYGAMEERARAQYANLSQAERRERLVEAQRKLSIERMKHGPPGHLCPPQICRATGRSDFWLRKRLKAAGLTADHHDGRFAWYAEAKLRAAKIIPAALVLALLPAAAGAKSAAVMTMPCFPAAEVHKALGHVRSEAPLMQGLSAKGSLMQLWASRDGDTWTVTLTAPDGTACLVAAGKSLERGQAVAAEDEPS